MSLTEITAKLNELASHWEQFKVVNDRRLKEIEQRGTPDPLTSEQVRKLNSVLDGYKDNIERLETALHRPYATSKAQLLSSSEQKYKQAFCDYLRKGNESGLGQLESKALSAGADADGGYLVTSYMTETMIKTIEDNSPMRQLASITSISTDALELIEDHDTASAGWTTETEARPDTKTPQIGKKIIPVHELYAQPKATQKLIDDASIDIESWLASKLTDVFVRMENSAFINGDGKGKPRGILACENSKTWGKIEQIATGDPNNITTQGVFELYFSLREVYAVRAQFLMSRAAVQALRLLKDNTNGQYLWQPGLAAGNPDTVFGCAVTRCADMPGLGKGSIIMAFADFKCAYQIVDRQGIRVLRDPYTDKPFVKYYTTRRVGGDVTNFEAIKLLRLAA